MGEVLNIDRFMGKVKPRIYRVGIELEGGWEKLPEGIAALEHDGSVQIPQPRNSNRDHPPIQWMQHRDGFYYRTDPRTGDRLPNQRGRTHNQAMRETEEDQIANGVKSIKTGEINSPILDLQSWKGWMIKHYPQHVNHTCGLHVHMSFRKAIHYERLMIPEYQDTVVAYLIKWAKDENIPVNHPIWPRLAGENEFCKLEFHPDAQARIKKKDYNHRTGSGNRYTAINYCWDQHNTLECRILPMLETAEQGIRAVQQVLDVTNACLRLMVKKEKVVSAELITNSINGILGNKKETTLEREITRNTSNGF